MPRSRRLTPILLALASSACDPAEPQDPAPLILPYVQSGVPWVFDDDGHQYLVDTGTPRSFVIPDLAGLAADSFSVTAIAGWDVLGLGGGAEVVVTWDLPPPMLPMIGPEFGGILGADILARRPFVLDPYRGRLVIDDDGELDEWFGASSAIHEIPVDVAGGGTACMSSGRCFTHEGLRMLVEVELDGVATLALVDTASTYTTLSAGLFERLPAADRPEIVVNRGWDSWRFTRIARTQIGDVALDDMPVRVDPDTDVALARLSVEVDRPVEMLLGHSFLLHYAAGFDYRAETLTLARYAAPQAVETEMFVGYGIWPADTVERYGCFVIAAVAVDSVSAAAGLEVGDCITAVAGTPADELGFAEFERRMRIAAIGEALELAVIDQIDQSAGAYASQARDVTLTKRDTLPQ